MRFRLEKFEKALVFQVLDMRGDLRIRFRLEKFKRAVVFQVLDMRGDLRECDDFKASNGVEVRSGRNPSLKAHGSTLDVHLRRRDDTVDFYPAGIAFRSNEKRDEYYEKVIQALKEWADHRSKEEKALPLANLCFKAVKG